MSASNAQKSRGDRGDLPHKMWQWWSDGATIKTRLEDSKHQWIDIIYFCYINDRYNRIIYRKSVLLPSNVEVSCRFPFILHPIHFTKTLKTPAKSFTELTKSLIKGPCTVQFQVLLKQPWPGLSRPRSPKDQNCKMYVSKSYRSRRHIMNDYSFMNVCH